MPAAISRRAESLNSSVYRVGKAPDGVVPVPLNVGDTFLPPPEATLDHDEPHRYTPPAGLPSLREALAARIATRNGLEVDLSQVMVTPGGTAALSALVGAMADPGDAIMICAPHWPLIAGIARVAMAEPLQVPIFDGELSAERVSSQLERFHRAGTRALYVNPIHNPSGRILPLQAAEAMVEFARRHDLWIFADDVYEDFVFDDSDWPRLMRMAPERTIHIGSASKAFGIAGARVGWAAGPAEIVKAGLKIHLNTGYCAPRWGQRMTEQLLEVGGAGERWQAKARAAYAEAGRSAAQRLGVEAPLGGQFMFVSVAEHLDRDQDSPLTDFLQRCLNEGVSLAPGTSCGPFPEHVRVCFTCAHPDEVARGVESMARVMGR
ncbi:MAG: pyridoxal phosphate-dependent aminotransferase [Myxococcota bacterium]